MVDLSTLDMASLTFNGCFNLYWVNFISLLRLSPRQTWSSNTLSFHGALFDILCTMVTIFLELAWLLLQVSLLCFSSVWILFEHPTRHITSLVVIIIVVAPLVLARASFLPSAFQSGSGNIWRAPLMLPIIAGCTGELTHITLQCPCSTRNPMAHRSECGLPSAVSRNCLVSPSSWESRLYPQSSLYTQYLIVTFTGRPFNLHTSM